MEGSRRRPLGIWMIVILELINAVITLADIVLGTTIADPRIVQFLGDGQAVRGGVIVWAALVITAAVLLWRLDRQGWALMMVLVGFSLVSNLSLWWVAPDRTHWVSMAVSVATAFYLNSSAVRRLFQDAHEVPRITLSERADR